MIGLMRMPLIGRLAVTAENSPTSSKLVGANWRHVSQLMQVASTKKLPATLESSRFVESAMVYLIPAAIESGPARGST